MNKRQTGSEWEQKAADYLAHNGMCIRERNFRNRQGEIDIIGTHDGYLVFAEVKYRSSPFMGHAAEAVDFRKQKQICRVADYYRLRNGYSDSTPVRYDVLAIEGEQIRWIQNAFSHVYSGGYR